MKSHILRLVLACLWCWAPLIPLRAIPLWVFAGVESSSGGGTSPGTSSLLAWWALANTLDASGNGRNLSVVSSPSYTTGLVGNGGLLDTTNEWWSISDADWQTPTGSFSVGGWFKPSDGRPDTFGSGIFGKWGTTGANRSWLLINSTSGSMSFLVSADGTNTAVTSTSTTLLANGAASAYVFLVGVFESSTSVKLYVNGVLEGNITASVPASVNNGTQSIGLGGYNSGSAYVSQGMFDEFFMYEKVLTADNVTWLYNSGAGKTFNDL